MLVKKSPFLKEWAFFMGLVTEFLFPLQEFLGVY